MDKRNWSLYEEEAWAGDLNVEEIIKLNRINSFYPTIHDGLISYSGIEVGYKWKPSQLYDRLIIILASMQFAHKDAELFLCILDCIYH